METYFPRCDAPKDITITQPTPLSINTKWGGPATTYKLAYKREEETAYTILKSTGPGSSGGSGYNTDDTGAGGAAGAQVASADFTFAVTAGVYEMRLINICTDGSVYEKLEKWLVEPAVGIIPNLRLISKDELEIKVMWDDPTIDSGLPIFITWCETDHMGKAINCEGAELASTKRTYSIQYPTHNRYRIFVSQFHNQWSHSSSNELLVYLCRCGSGRNTSETYIATHAYVHDQAVAASVWYVEHNLGFFPNANMSDRLGKDVGGIVQYIDENILEIRFSKPVAGFGYLS